jgi:K+ transporter
VRGFVDATHRSTVRLGPQRFADHSHHRVHVGRRHCQCAQDRRADGVCADTSDGLLRVRGAAVFPHRGDKTGPLALRANVEHNHVLHEHVVIVTIDTLSIPRGADSERIEIDPLGDTHDGIIHVAARFGYMERLTSTARCVCSSRRGPRN